MRNYACKHNAAVGGAYIDRCVKALNWSKGTAIEEDIRKVATKGLNEMVAFPFAERDCKKISRAFEKGAGREDVEAACKMGRESHKAYKKQKKEFKKAIRKKEFWKADSLAKELCKRTDCVETEDNQFEMGFDRTVCCYQMELDQARHKEEIKQTKKAERKRVKELQKLKRSVPKYERTCKQQATINWKAVKKRKKAIAKGRLSAAERQDKIIGKSYRKACEARSNAFKVYHAYRNSGDRIAAEAVESAIQSCIRYWGVCDR